MPYKTLKGGKCTQVFIGDASTIEEFFPEVCLAKSDEVMDMAYCKNCGLKISSDDKLCENCGTPANEQKNIWNRFFEGKVHKCPNCGEVIKSFTTVCPSCGFEFRNTNASNAVNEFSKKLVDMDPDNDQFVSFIKNFAVPNNREDVFEFMILASSNINTDVIAAVESSDAGANNEEELNRMKVINEAWISKVKQVYKKAKVAFGDDPDFYEIENIYNSTFSSIKVAEKKKSRKGLITVAIVLAFILFYVLFFGGLRMSHKNNEKELEAIVDQIEIYIENEDYDSALIYANKLHMDDGWSDESKKHWDQERKYLIKMIEKKQKEHEKSNPKNKKFLFF